MIVKYEPEVLKKFPMVYDRVQSSSIDKIVLYVIDSNYRVALSLKSWLKDFVTNPSQTVLEIANRQIPTYQSYDQQIIEVLNWVRFNITYVSDQKQWERLEYWQRPEETLLTRQGDCEDGAILIYTLARLKGIPENRLLLCCGDVHDPAFPNNSSVTVGHCYLMYVPELYPLNYTVIDWCYYYDGSNVDDRSKFVIFDTDITEYKYMYSPLKNGYFKVDSDYRNLWFAFSENFSYSGMREKVLEK